MARVETITLISDLDSSVAADVTVTFGVDGKVRHIDLSHQQAAELREALAPYLAASRPATGGGRPTATRTARTTDAVGNAAVRAWARNNGYDTLADRGRIPAKVLQAYTKAKAS